MQRALRRSAVAAAAAPRRRVSSVGVVGAGQMGTGIAYVAAVTAKLPVVLYDKSAEQLGRAQALCKSLLAKEVERKRISAEDSAQALERIKISAALEPLAGADFLVEVRGASLQPQSAASRASPHRRPSRRTRTSSVACSASWIRLPSPALSWPPIRRPSAFPSCRSASLALAPALPPLTAQRARARRTRP
jgi:threonine dehydrogenase-like Zn-dependent dehydrogenase